MVHFHPDLALARFFPTPTIGPRLAKLGNAVPRRTPAPPSDVLIEEVVVPATTASAAVTVRLYRSRLARGATPALLWVHGGGMVLGSPLQDEERSIAFARTLGITVAAVTYRLAPQHPAPAALEDCYAALSHLADHADDHGLDPTRIAVGGASAGGGLAAGTTLMAHDRGGPAPAFQLLVYPMLDDRTVTRPVTGDRRGLRMWNQSSNRFGWTSYLGREPGGEGVSAYAAPARRDDLGGLPPAWVGVGTLDLFHDEDVDYAHRLRLAGVPCELEVVPGAFHGFDGVMPGKGVSQAFRSTQAQALRRALLTTPADGA